MNQLPGTRVYNEPEVIIKNENCRGAVSAPYHANYMEKVRNYVYS